MEILSSNELKQAIKEAVKKSVEDLFKINENFYWLVLITTEEAHPPLLSAWSFEALNKYNNDINKKWSYYESPYFNYGQKYFLKANKLFNLRPVMDEKMTDKEWNKEYNF
jgi:hypothetical protein